MRVGLLALLCGLLTACGDSNEIMRVKNFIEDTQTQPKSKIAPIPEFKHVELFAYNAGILRDPFILPKPKLQLNPELRPDTNRPKEPLEEFPLDSLNMVGTLRQGPQRYWGLISAPDGVVYKVTVGSYVGKNYGKILSITDAQIKLEETIQDANGAWQQRGTKLELKK